MVGETLREFLALGCRSGYLVLEQMAYDYDWIVEELERRAFAPDDWPEKREDLETLSRHFKLEPWSGPRNRLEELMGRFENSMEFAVQ